MQEKWSSVSSIDAGSGGIGKLECLYPLFFRHHKLQVISLLVMLISLLTETSQKMTFPKGE